MGREEPIQHLTSDALQGDLAGELGFEPRLADPESAVLPLDDSPAPWDDSQGVYVVNKGVT